MATVTKKKSKTRKHNKGAWYRAERGWYATERNVSVKLCYPDGQHIKDPNAKEDANRAFAVFTLTGREERINRKTGGITVNELVDKFLHWSKENEIPKTYEIRACCLFEFANGIPAKFRKVPKNNWPNVGSHCKGLKAFGDVPVNQLNKADIKRWVNLHETWGENSKRRFYQTLRRCINWAIPNETAKPVRKRADTGNIISREDLVDREGNLLPADFVNPCLRLAPSGSTRVINITPEQEQVLYKFASKPLALAIRVCIRTGMRYGKEFTNLTAEHIHTETIDGVERMAFVMPKQFNKNKKGKRVIYVAAELVDLIKEQKRKNPRGALFRNNHNTKWTQDALGQLFATCVKKAKAAGHTFEEGLTAYAMRHTFAKRMVTGYWGEPCTIEVLAAAMGNRPEVAAKYTEDGTGAAIYQRPIWRSIQ